MWPGALVNVFAFVFIALHCAWDARSQQPDNVGACLLRGQCDTQRDCSSLLYSPSCLDTAISPSLARAPALLECCFHCCYQHYLNLYGLQPAARTLSAARASLHRPFPATYVTLGASLGEAGSEGGPAGLLLGATQAALSLSAHFVTARGKVGNPPVQQLATLTVEYEEAGAGASAAASSPASSDSLVDVNAPLSAARIAALNTLPWAELRASEAILFTPRSSALLLPCSPWSTVSRLFLTPNNRPLNPPVPAPCSLTRCAPLALSAHPLTSTQTGLPVSRSLPPLVPLAFALLARFRRRQP